MEPGLRDREYSSGTTNTSGTCALQWSPVLETGNTSPLERSPAEMALLQWSPVLETGNT